MQLNYIGSKYKLSNFIISTIQEHSNSVSGEITDLFAGTGIIGKKFRELGYKVTSNDIQYYSYILNKHFIENSSNDIKNNLISYFDNLKPKQGFIWKNYCKDRKYFSEDNGKNCDSIRTEIEKLFKLDLISEKEYYYYIASLLVSIDAYANTTGVYVSYLKSLKEKAQKLFNYTGLDFTKGVKGTVYNEDSLNLIDTLKGDILYIDPPYNNRNYGNNYHVLETIARYDNPHIEGITGMRYYFKSPFCYNKSATDCLNYLVNKANFKFIYLSYNNEGLISENNIIKILNQHGAVDLFKKDYHRYKADNRRTYKDTQTVEYLFCLKKY